jgi:hypothetical protein
MEPLLLILIAILIGVVVFLSLRSKSTSGNDVARELSDVRKELQQRLDRIDDQIDKKMQHSQVTLQEQFKQSSKIISVVTE